MKWPLFVLLLWAAVMTSCALFPRRDTVAYPAAGGTGPAPEGVFVDKVDVDRRVLSREVARDVENLILVLAPGHGFAVTSHSAEKSWPIRVHVVEREIIKDFSPQYSIMISLEMLTSVDAQQAALTVVHTSESSDSISSPWTLKRILNDCLGEAARAFAAGRGK